MELPVFSEHLLRERQRRLGAEARQALQTYGIPVCRVAISQRAAFGHALIDGRAINEFDPGGKAAAEIDRLWQTVRADLKT